MKKVTIYVTDTYKLNNNQQQMKNNNNANNENT